MKSIKIKSYDSFKILKQAGVVKELSPNKFTADPSRVYVSKNDYKKIRNVVTKAAKKQRKYLTGRSLSLAVEMHLLDLGPNTSLSAAIKDGWMLVQEEV